MTHTARLAAVFLGLVLASGPSAFGAITVDGGLSDWGITLVDDHLSPNAVYSHSTSYLPDPPTAADTWSTVYGGMTVYYQIEDKADSSGIGVGLGPDAGGQDYDAELMVVHFDSTMLYVGIGTGQRPDNGYSYFIPGDVRIVTSTGQTFGVEVGGGPGVSASMTSDAEITEGDAGYFYALNGSGYASSVSLANPATRVAGSIWLDPSWYVESIGGSPATRTQIAQGSGGTLRGTADLSYFFPASSQHAFIELGIPMALLTGAGSLTSVGWSPVCGNDLLEVYLPKDLVPTVSQTPEPASLLVWSTLALAGVFAGFWRRRRRSTAG
jgi:hypothetical protein